ncbi:hypothetical protein DIPPA_33780 [Diplonema papillatum]|nr:hypothetical protein DIPPA_33780 [Diplonema papillatum]
MKSPAMMFSLPPEADLRERHLSLAPEVNKMLDIGSSLQHETPFVRRALEVQSNGVDFVKELNGQSIAFATWEQWEKATTTATTRDERKTWSTGEGQYYSPRGVYTMRKSVEPLWRALPTRQLHDSSWQVAKSFPLPHLEELIEKVYESKARADIRYAHTSVPKQTLKQHMVQWIEKAAVSSGRTADTVLKQTFAAINRHKANSVKVSVFDAIINNEVDEGARMVHFHLEKRIEQVLKILVAQLVPGSQLVHERLFIQRRDGHLSQDEWEDIVRLLYNDEDARVVVLRCLDKIASYTPQRKRIGPVSVPNPDAHPGYIKYSDFVAICGAFQLEAQKKYLQPFVVLFQSVATGGEGTVGDTEFRSLIVTLKPQASRGLQDTLLDLVDTKNSGYVTFSDAVSCLGKLIREWLNAPARQRG